MKFLLLIRTKMLKNKDCRIVEFIMLINVNICCILAFMSLIKCMLSCVEHEKKYFIALGKMSHNQASHQGLYAVCSDKQKYILRKTIEGYLDSVPSLTFNTIKKILIMHTFHSSIYLQSK